MNGFGGFIATPSMDDINRIDLAISQIRTILLVLMADDPSLNPSAAERFRREWYPKAVDE